MHRSNAAVGTNLKAVPTARESGLLTAKLAAIKKNFGPVRALKGVDLELRASQVHALLGENGAGKTTLMLVLAGILRPDDGTIEINGQSADLRGRRDGALRGIGIVQQHYGLVEELTGTENFLLGHPHAPIWLNRRRAQEVLSTTAERFGLSVKVDKPVAELTIGERQRLEILIALATGAEIMIFDEPTAALPSADVEQLMLLVQQLAAEGKAVVYITHKLREVMTLADVVTVMRRGEAVLTLTRGNLDPETLATAMIGRVPKVENALPKTPGEIVVKLQNVSVVSDRLRCGLTDVSFAIRRSEIVGVAGVLGSGQEALAELLCGLVLPDEGVVAPKPEIIGYIPEDRAHAGIAPALSIIDNAIVHWASDRRRRGSSWLDRRKMTEFAQQLVDEGLVAADSVQMPASALSGGNQQKLIVAREFEREPPLIVAHNPYRGLDVGASTEVRKRLIRARDQGCGILLISPDLDELFDIADRILVLSHGRLVGSVDPRAVSLAELGALISGFGRDKDAA